MLAVGYSRAPAAKLHGPIANRGQDTYSSEGSTVPAH